MPKRIPSFRPCSLPGPRDQRPNSARRGYNWAWRRYRLMFLRRNPVCAMCGRAAEHVDHIVPVAGGQADPGFWDPANHQSLCRGCHNKKTAGERKRSGERS